MGKRLENQQKIAGQIKSYRWVLLQSRSDLEVLQVSGKRMPQ